jgi:hypothetical protein
LTESVTTNEIPLMRDLAHLYFLRVTTHISNL